MSNFVKQLFYDLFKYEDKSYHNFILPETEHEKSKLHDGIVNSNNNDNNTEKNKSIPKELYNAIDVNLEIVKQQYNADINSDIVVRDFNLTARNKQYKAFLLYIDGMVNTDSINHFVLNPLMLRNTANMYDNSETEVVRRAISNNIVIRKVKKFDLADYIYNNLVPQNSVEKLSDFEKIASSVNMGNCLLFVDTLNVAFDIDVKGFKQRSVDKPENEIVIRGPHEAFVESIRTNTSLVRRIINNEHLIIENVEIGKISKTKCAICYLNNVANNNLVGEVKYRLNNIAIDYLTSAGQLEQLIEDNGKYSLPQLIATERPDKASNYILEGRVIIIVNGSPYALIAPATFLDFLCTPEDYNLKYQFSNLLKFIRILALLITLLLPGFYIAIVNFHQELLPTELLFSIVASRETVPFPILFELVIMEVSFELIREAGLRVPSPIGPTIGIVGALVLGQAAVDASIVSPILIIIVAITGITSFAVPDFSLGFYCRISRFTYLISGFLFGFLGIALVGSFHIIIACSIKSFGTPYLQPFVPMTENLKGILLSPAWKRERRADFLNPKREFKQDKISMNWKNDN